MFSTPIVMLPTRPNAVRVRIWRALKALGCAALRDGAYLLPADTAQVPRGALGCDLDGARFGHLGARVTFEVLCAAFGLDADPQLQRLAAVVRHLDAGGIPAPEAAGLESGLSGLRELHVDDDALAAAAATPFDALCAAPGVPA